MSTFTILFLLGVSFLHYENNDDLYLQTLPIYKDKVVITKENNNITFQKFDWDLFKYVPIKNDIIIRESKDIKYNASFELQKKHSCNKNEIQLTHKDYSACIPNNYLKESAYTSDFYKVIKEHYLDGIFGKEGFNNLAGKYARKNDYLSNFFYYFTDNIYIDTSGQFYGLHVSEIRNYNLKKLKFDIKKYDEDIYIFDAYQNKKYKFTYFIIFKKNLYTKGVRVNLKNPEHKRFIETLHIF